jgi:hypothetical protein
MFVIIEYYIYLSFAERRGSCHITYVTNGSWFDLVGFKAAYTVCIQFHLSKYIFMYILDKYYCVTFAYTTYL